MVMENGELIEFDKPDILLANPDSFFSLLVEQTGTAEAEHLRSLANAKLSQQ